MNKYHQEWEALPRERKLKVIEEAVTVEEEYQVSISTNIESLCVLYIIDKTGPFYQQLCKLSI